MNKKYVCNFYTSLTKTSHTNFEDSSHLKTTHWSAGLKTIYRHFFLPGGGGGGQWPKSSCGALESGARSPGFVPPQTPFIVLEQDTFSSQKYW